MILLLLRHEVGTLMLNATLYFLIAVHTVICQHYHHHRGFNDGVADDQRNLMSIHVGQMG